MASKVCRTTTHGICCGKDLPLDHFHTRRTLCKNCYNANKKVKYYNSFGNVSELSFSDDEETSMEEKSQKFDEGNLELKKVIDTEEQNRKLREENLELKKMVEILLKSIYNNQNKTRKAYYF